MDSKDSKGFIRLTDTYILSDVWFQPISVEDNEDNKDSVVDVRMFQVLFCPEIKYRIVVVKMASDDLLRTLYLADKLHNELKGIVPIGYEDWVRVKSSECIKEHGVEEGIKKTVLLKFIMGHPEFTLYPPEMKICGFFFKKICVHEYKTPEESIPFNNPMMMVCKAAKSAFEYVLQVNIFSLPLNWIGLKKGMYVEDVETEEDIPESLPY